MGLVLGSALLAGVAVGLAVTAATGGLALAITIGRAKRRLYVWRVVVVGTAVFVAVLALLVQQFGNEPVRPGNDYDVVMRNFFVCALGYSAAPGVAALLAAVLSSLCPRKPAADAQELTCC